MVTVIKTPHMGSGRGTWPSPQESASRTGPSSSPDKEHGTCGCRCGFGAHSLDKAAGSSLPEVLSCLKETVQGQGLHSSAMFTCDQIRVGKRPHCLAHSPGLSPGKGLLPPARRRTGKGPQPCKQEAHAFTIVTVTARTKLPPKQLCPQ